MFIFRFSGHKIRVIIASFDLFEPCSCKLPVKNVPTEFGCHKFGPTRMTT